LLISEANLNNLVMIRMQHFYRPGVSFIGPDTGIKYYM